MRTTPALQRPVLLALALVAVCGTALVGIASAAVPTVAAQASGAPVGLEIEPAKALAERGRHVLYTAEVVDAGGGRTDATRVTDLSFSSGVCRPGLTEDGIDVYCSEDGLYAVTGAVKDPPLESGKGWLRVLPRGQRILPGISPVPSSPPNREVEVTGSTGSCNQRGTLTLQGIHAAPLPVAGEFTARFNIPAGTFPNDYPLLLEVDCDEDKQQASGELTVDNQRPDAVEDQIAIDANPDVPVPIKVLGNDVDPDDPDGYETRLTVERDPAHGTAKVRRDQSIDYTPGKEFVDAGKDEFTYRYCDVVGDDGATDCDTATVTVGKRPPEPVDDSGISTVQGQPVVIDVMRNDHNAGKLDLPLLRARPLPTTTGRTEPPSEGRIRYIPDPGFTGEDSFQYDYCGGPTVVNAAVQCPLGTVTVTVTPRPVAPEISSVEPNPSPPNREVEVTGNTGSCNQKGTLRMQVAGASPVPVTGKFTTRLPIPTGTFPGEHRVLLSVRCNGDDQQADFEFAVKNQPPKAADDDATTIPGRRVRIDVVRNDEDPDDPDGYATRVQEASPGPSHGSIEVQEDQTIVYTPGEGFDRRGDQFDYGYCDVVGADRQTACGTATVTVTRTPPRPVDDAISTVRGEKVLIPVTANDEFPDEADLHVSRPPKQPGATAVVQREPPGSILYTPVEGFTGTDTFEYDYCPVVVNAAAPPVCPFATVTVTVTPPPVAPRIDSVDPDPSPPNHEVAVKGTTGTCDRAARLTLDSAPEAAAPVTVTGGRGGDFGAKVKLPPGTYVGSYPLALRVVCGGRARAVEYQLKVANQPPRAADDPAATTMDTPVSIDVAGNDPDPDGDDGYRTSLDPGTPEHGTAVEQQPGNRIRYIPAKGFTGEDRFRYRFCELVDANDTADCGAATVIVTVREPSPEAVDDSATTVRDRPVRIEVTGNDRHPDPAKLHVSRPPTSPATAVEQRQPPGGILYNPARGFTGTDTFQYDYCGGSVVVDAAGRAACTPATVTVTVTKPDPVPVDDPDVTTVAGQPVVVDVMGNDRDPDASRLRLRPDPRASGRPEQLPDGRIRYTAGPGQTGTDTFRYDYCRSPVESDAGRACPFATVTVTVTAIPTISSVRPDSSPAGRKVEVTGNTGSCKRVGTLSLRGTSAAVGVNGDRDGGFTASLAVPPGTFPGGYRLELRVDCNGRVQRAEGLLTVTNRAPEPVDDPATTTPDTPVTIDVAGNDRDPDDPDGHRNLVLVTSLPANGTAEVQPDQTIVYTPASGFAGQDRFGYSLCDDVLNAAGGADCGAATVTVTVSPTACVPAGSTPRLEVDPGKGRGGTSLRITAAVDRRLAACPLRFFLGATPLGPDVRVGDDGSISADRGVPGDAKRGRSSVRLATQNAQTLAERPFEVVGGPVPWPVRLALGAGALLVGALARLAVRRWRERPSRRLAELPDDVRAEPHTRPVEVGVEPVTDGTRTFAVRLEPHADAGHQTLQE